MSKPLKLHWASSKPNFGDWLSPEIVAHLSGRKVEHSSIDKCDILAVGSLLQRVKEGFFKRQINVWGTGYIDQPEQKKSRHIYHAVRGKQSAAAIKNAQIDSFGDPGLLVDQIYTKSVTTKRLGIVPHYKDQDNAFLKRLATETDNTVVIDVFESPKQVVEKITQCEFVVSSSLHGLIIADAFGIPNQWLQVSDNVRGNGWKFADYYSVFGIESPKPFTFSEPNAGFDQIVESIGDYRRPALDSVKEKLTAAFPFARGVEV